MSVNAFLLVCNVYTFEPYHPAPELMHTSNIRDIVNYLHKSHTYYMDVAVHILANDLEKLLGRCDEKHGRIIRKFFADYKDELAKHFDYEEYTVFPYVESVLDGTRPDGYNILQYEENHSNVEEKLGDLRSIVMRYLPTVCDREDVATVLEDLYVLNDDLLKHTFIEDEILVPMVNSLEHRKSHTPYRGGSEAAEDGREELSPREKEILVSVASGMLNKEIADKYCISIHTVITHRKNITRKTGIKTVAGLTVYALLNNLIDINTFE